MCFITLHALHGMGNAVDVEVIWLWILGSTLGAFSWVFSIAWVLDDWHYQKRTREARLLVAAFLFGWSFWPLMAVYALYKLPASLWKKRQALTGRVQAAASHIHQFAKLVGPQTHVESPGEGQLSIPKETTVGALSNIDSSDKIGR